jgi:hypothetical protein
MPALENSKRSDSDLSHDLTRAADALKDIQVARGAQSSAMAGLPPAMFGAGGPM